MDSRGDYLLARAFWGRLLCTQWGFYVRGKGGDYTMRFKHRNSKLP